MAAEHMPVELIPLPPVDPAAHPAAEKKDLLAQRRLSAFLSSHQRAALRYQPSNELLLAINMVLHTGSPLLLTGEPGTGKTQAADFVGAYFDIPVYKFLVKSTSAAQDLLYEFDAVGYLHWAQSGGRQPAMQNASDPGVSQQSSHAIATETQAVRHGFLHKRALWEAYETDGDAVVLIDEIDRRAFSYDLCMSRPAQLRIHSILADVRHGRTAPIIATSNEERR
jgi:MoxR-like ATPase